MVSHLTKPYTALTVPERPEHFSDFGFRAWLRTMVQPITKLRVALENHNAQQEARSQFFMPSLCHLYTRENCLGDKTVDEQERNPEANKNVGA